MGKKQPTSIGQEGILFIVEILLKTHLRANISLLPGIFLLDDLPFVSFQFCLTKRIESILQELLREPLKDREFRRHFNVYFEKHEDPQLRAIAGWLDTLLEWDV